MQKWTRKAAAVIAVICLAFGTDVFSETTYAIENINLYIIPRTALSEIQIYVSVQFRKTHPLEI